MIEVSIDMLRNLIRYEPDTGEMFWRERPSSMFKDGFYSADTLARSWNSRYSGKKCGCGDTGGYLRVSVHDRLFLAHRIAWAITYGEWPDEDIDHINGDRSDNRLRNLRTVTKAQNQRNQKKFRNNTSGVCGVYFIKSSKKWVAQIAGHHIGTYNTRGDAAKARRADQRDRGYSARHGR